MILEQVPWWANTAMGGGLILLIWAGSDLLTHFRRSRRTESAPLLAINLEGAESLEAVITRILQQISTWVPGRAYHGYWLGEGQAAYRLRSSLTVASQPAVAPDYSGLVLEQGLPVPVSLPSLDRTTPQVSGPRDDRFIDFPLGNHLLVRIYLGALGDIRRDQMRRLAIARTHYAPLVHAIDRWFAAKNASAHSTALMESARRALDVTLRIDLAVELLLQVGNQLVGAAVPFAMLEGVDQVLTVATNSQGKSLANAILQGAAPKLLQLPGVPDVVPGSHLGQLSSSFNACIRIPVVINGEEPAGCFYFFTEHAPALSSYQTAVLRTLGDRTAQLLANQREMQSASTGYLETLRVLVAAMDGLSPYSLGHSDRLARYARITAQALGLSAQETEAVAMAAYFHDVGMVAVDSRIVLKPDRVTEDEYTQIKRHAELGAQLLNSVPASLPLAPMVASHHERWDGHGYPACLHEQQIPLGARIIAVADLFDARTTGRSYRSPRPFAQAVEDIKSVAGSHLDPTVVKAFVTAIQAERRAKPSGLPTARCWELKQMPEHVCGNCPNRTAQVTACWENPNHLCTRHGDKCETCIVYTQAMPGVTYAAH